MGDSRRRPKTYAYIDGFNLYYGLFRPPAPALWRQYRWLDLERFCDLLLPRNDVIAVRYYTADVANRPPGFRQSTKQQAYLKALSTLNRVETIKGHFVGPSPRRMQGCDAHGSPTGAYEWVLKTEEKGSDVNLAVDLLHDCLRGRFECAVVISNDSDLARAVRIARTGYGKIIGVANPHARHQEMSRDLARLRDFSVRITEQILRESQLPDEVHMGGRVVRRPADWSASGTTQSTAP